MGGIESLEQAADELADTDPASLSDEELGDVLVRTKFRQSASEIGRFCRSFVGRAGWGP